MEGNTTGALSGASEPNNRRRIIQWNGPQPIRATVTKRAADLGRRSQATPDGVAPEAPTHRKPINYSFVPYPLELVEMERQRLLSPVKLRILGFRRFAHPIHGVWATTTREVARLAQVDRSTAHKALRALEKAQFLHIERLRSATSRLLIYFGGFSRPAYVSEGKPPLHWDAGHHAGGTLAAQLPSQCGPQGHSGEAPEIGWQQPQTGIPAEVVGTLPKEESEKEDIRNNERRPAGALTPVDKFTPTTHDEDVVLGLAKRLGEPYINGFLALRRAYGLARLQRACGIARDKATDTNAPLRQSPGAYVRWLLQNGKS